MDQKDFINEQMETETEQGVKFRYWKSDIVSPSLGSIPLQMYEGELNPILWKNLTKPVINMIWWFSSLNQPVMREDFKQSIQVSFLHYNLSEAAYKINAGTHTTLLWKDEVTRIGAECDTAGIPFVKYTDTIWSMYLKPIHHQTAVYPNRDGQKRTAPVPSKEIRLLFTVTITDMLGTAIS